MDRRTFLGGLLATPFAASIPEPVAAAIEIKPVDPLTIDKLRSIMKLLKDAQKRMEEEWIIMIPPESELDMLRFGVGAYRVNPPLPGVEHVSIFDLYERPSDD